MANLKITIINLLIMAQTILQLATAPETIYERPWTDHMLFSMDCSTFYNQISGFTKQKKKTKKKKQKKKKLGLRLHKKAWFTPSTHLCVCVCVCVCVCL